MAAQSFHAGQFRKKTGGGMHIMLILLSGLGIATIIIVAMFGVWRFFPSTIPGFLRQEPDSSDTQVIRAMKRTEEVSLLSLGVTGIESQEKNSHFFSMEIPGSDRARFIQYTFDAKLGFEGKDVTIHETSDKHYDISIPEFKFIGYDNPEYRVVVETNGILSFGTPQIDSTEMINKILSDKAKSAYIEDNKDLLQDQAKLFYTSIIMSIDPDVKLNFQFQDAPAD